MAWWAEVFQPPCVGYAPSLDEVPDLVADGADFVALGGAMWDDPATAADVVRRAAAMLTKPARS